MWKFPNINRCSLFFRSDTCHGQSNRGSVTKLLGCGVSQHGCFRRRHPVGVPREMHPVSFPATPEAPMVESNEHGLDPKENSVFHFCLRSRRLFMYLLKSVFMCAHVHTCVHIACGMHTSTLHVPQELFTLEFMLLLL